MDKCIFIKNKQGIYLALSTLLFSCLVILFIGCRSEIDIGNTDSEVWAEMPSLTYGSIASEELISLPWNSGRCEATSSDTMTETAQGYYLLNGTPAYLNYADKSNLDNWVIVCNQPECNHAGCGAVFKFGTFVMRNGHIYYTDLPKGILKTQAGKQGPVLICTEADGTNPTIALEIDEISGSNIISGMTYLTSQHWLSNIMVLNADGSSTVHSFRVTDSGVEKLATVENASPEHVYIEVNPPFLCGDKIIFNGALGTAGDVYLRYQEDGVQTVDLSNLPTRYAYLSGSTLRYFQSNDGYYDRNINTGETVKLAEAQLENSMAAVVLPNCIVECTLLGSESSALRTDGMIHRMTVFDGKVWHDVKLPQELLHAGKQVSLWVQSVTSDKIIVYCRDLETYRIVPKTTYYSIDISEIEWELEQFAQITEQWYIIEQEKKNR